MPKREAPFRIVPRVFAEDGGGYARPARCVHCGLVITTGSLAWGSLVSDPQELKRPVHRGCKSEYEASVVAFNVEPDRGTPAL
jgi:hypothetical protein